MNRRHMTGDHHGQTAGRATPLARAMDEILGTHRHLRQRPRYPWHVLLGGGANSAACSPAAHTRLFTTIVRYWFPMRAGPVQPPADAGMLNWSIPGAVRI